MRRKNILITVIVFILLVSLLASCSARKDWRTASRESAGLAPQPQTSQEAVLQVYSASAWGWRGWFAVHTWIATKRTAEDFYTVYEVIGWRERHGLPVVRIARDLPDRYWFGAKPALLKDRRGPGVDDLINRVDQAAREYPWQMTYTVFPGPNSNTFTAWVAQQVPELELELPFSAIGSGYADR